jgi:hypothetical protein
MLKAIGAILMLCGFAIHLSGQTQHGTSAKKPPSNPQGQATSTFVNNSCNETCTDSTKNQTSHWYASPEWWLVIVAIPTLILIWYQARATAKSAKATEDSVEEIKRQVGFMERQTKAAEDAATAAKNSSDVLANIERAWVDILVKRQGNTGYFWEITNYGRTVAHIKELHLVIRLTPSDGSTPSGAERTYPRNKLLVPQAPWPALHLDLIHDLGERTFAMVRSGEMRLDYTFTVRYEGIVPNGSSESLHYYDTANSYQCLRPVEAPQYNPRD